MNLASYLSWHWLIDFLTGALQSSLNKSAYLFPAAKHFGLLLVGFGMKR